MSHHRMRRSSTRPGWAAADRRWAARLMPGSPTCARPAPRRPGGADRAESAAAAPRAPRAAPRRQLGKHGGARQGRAQRMRELLGVERGPLPGHRDPGEPLGDLGGAIDRGLGLPTARQVVDSPIDLAPPRVRRDGEPPASPRTPFEPPPAASVTAFRGEDVERAARRARRGCRVCSACTAEGARAVIRPTRRPVNGPGPTPTATPVSSVRERPASASTFSIPGASSSPCLRASISVCSASTPSSPRSATVTAGVAVSKAKSSTRPLSDTKRRPLDTVDYQGRRIRRPVRTRQIPARSPADTRHEQAPAGHGRPSAPERTPGPCVRRRTPYGTGKA
jgi:hypothetical protein